MGKPYSQDLRERVLFNVDGGTAVGAVATTSRVSVSYIYKVPASKPDNLRSSWAVRRKLLDSCSSAVSMA
jgi:hypothetical protein